jgi:peptidoglycan/LPS O-acetylase OafA/YrhL
MQLSKILNRDANNLDIFRVVAACMVVYGHAYAISPQAGHRDVVGALLGFDYSGSLGVKIFFFLSGLVVTNTLLDKRNPIQFAIARCFRIWPALIFTVLICAFVLGPMLTNLPLADYFSNPATYQYVYKNLLLKITYALPGVFSANPLKDSVNGSLWSIPHEVAAYLVLLSLYLMRVFNTRTLSILIFLVILVDPLTGNKLLLTWLPQNSEITLLAPCFAFGSLLAIWKEQITIDNRLVVALWILYFIFKASTYNFYFLYAALFISILHLSSLPVLVRHKPKADISYGIYLWGFPVQQIIASYLYAQGVIFNQLSSMLLCIAMGFASWHLIEKNSIAIGAKVGKRFLQS